MSSRTQWKAILVVVTALSAACGRVDESEGEVETPAATSRESLGTEPNGTCVHPVTVVGVKLTTTCSQCAANVCAKDSYCCNTSWDSICVGEVSSYCTATPVDAGTPAPFCGPVNVPGPKQSPTCGACQATVCAQDGYCCNTSWDSICVNKASTLCGDAGTGGDAGTAVDAGTFPPPTTANGLVNGTFEAGGAGWVFYGSAQIGSVPHGGAKSVSIFSGTDPMGPNTGGHAIHQTIAGTAATKTVSAWVRAAAAGTGTATVNLTMIESSGAAAGCGNPIAISTAWSKVSCMYFGAATPQTIRLSLYSPTSQAFFIDDVVIESIANNSFEYGNTGFTLSSGATTLNDNTRAHTGWGFVQLLPVTGYGANVLKTGVVPPPGATSLDVWLSTKFTGSGQSAVLFAGNMGCSVTTSSTTGSHSSSTYVKKSCPLNGQTGPIDLRVVFSVPSTLPVPAGASVLVDDFDFH